MCLSLREQIDMVREQELERLAYTAGAFFVPPKTNMNVEQSSTTGAACAAPSRRNMTRSEMFTWAAEYTMKCLELAQAKNSDYAQEDDPFFNLRRGGLHGIAVRLDDKISRLINLSDGRSAAVSDESLDDTLMDIFNYAWLAAAYRHEQKSPMRTTVSHAKYSRAPAWLKEDDQ